MKVPYPYRSAVSGDVGDNGTPHSSLSSLSYSFLDLPHPQDLLDSIYVLKPLSSLCSPSLDHPQGTVPLQIISPQNKSQKSKLSSFQNKPQLPRYASPQQHLLIYQSFHTRHPHHSSDKPHLPCLQSLLHFFTNIPGFRTV